MKNCLLERSRSTHRLTKLVLDASYILNDNVHDTVTSEVPPRTLHLRKVCLDLSDLSKKGTQSHVKFQNNLLVLYIP